MGKVIVESPKKIDKKRADLPLRNNVGAAPGGLNLTFSSRGIQVVLLALVVLIASSSAYAWDGERQGFLLGVGFGVGLESYSGIEYDYVGLDSEDNTTLAFAMSPRVGYAPSNQLAFYYSRHPFIFSAKNEAGEDFKLFSCTEALMAQYYLEESAPSVYFGFGAGVGYFMEFEVSNYSDDALKGFGLLGTVGFEPIKHFSSELSLHYKLPQESASDFGISILVNVLGY